MMNDINERKDMIKFNDWIELIIKGLKGILTAYETFSGTKIMI